MRPTELTKKEFNTVIIKQLKILSNVKNISIQNIADYLNVSRNQVNKYYLLQNTLPTFYLMQVFEILQISPSYFMTFLPGSSKDIIYKIHRGDIEGVKLDFKRGFDVDTKNASGATLLMIAVNCNDLEMTKFLLSKGANINARLDNITALSISLENECVPITELLLTHGAEYIKNQANE